jgi:monofunctional biosynthetic peptidoglycan transglycosylase
MSTGPEIMLAQENSIHSAVADFESTLAMSYHRHEMRRFGFRKVLKIFLVLILAAFVLGIGYSFVFPKIARLEKENPKLTSFMKHRLDQARKQGQKLEIQQSWIPLSRISPYLVHAVVIAEDDKFWGHKGFDLEAIRAALEKNIEKKTWKYGGSTITQQLAKNLFLSPSRSPLRKIREFILAWRLERTLSKKRILELYLNVVEWGDGIFGAEAAARHYYNQPASDLTPQEAAHLAVVLPSPRRYNPLSGSKYIESRAEEIYEIMLKRGII